MGAFIHRILCSIGIHAEKNRTYIEENGTWELQCSVCGGSWTYQTLGGRRHGTNNQ